MFVKKIEDYQIIDPEKMTKHMVFKEDKSQAFVLNFAPGQSLPSHGHPNTQVYLLVLEGEGRCTIDTTDYHIKEGFAIHCSKNQKLSIENNSNLYLSIYVVLARETV